MKQQQTNREENSKHPHEYNGPSLDSSMQSPSSFLHWQLWKQKPDAHIDDRRRNEFIGLTSENEILQVYASRIDEDFV